MFTMNGCWIWGPFVLLPGEILSVASPALAHWHCRRLAHVLGGGGRWCSLGSWLSLVSGGTVCFCHGGSSHVSLLSSRDGIFPPSPSKQMLPAYFLGALSPHWQEHFPPPRCDKDSPLFPGGGFPTACGTSNLCLGFHILHLSGFRSGWLVLQSQYSDGSRKTHWSYVGPDFSGPTFISGQEWRLSSILLARADAHTQSWILFVTLREMNENRIRNAWRGREAFSVLS